MIVSRVRIPGQVAVVVLLGLTSGCAGEAHRRETAPLPAGAIEQRCGPPPGFRPTPEAQPRPNARPNAGTAIPMAGSFRASDIADTLRTQELVTRIEVLDREDIRLRGLQLRQQLSTRLLLALLEVKSAAAEADCEEERANDLADRLQEIQEERVRRLTMDFGTG
jgi:hypothetical protein